MKWIIITLLTAFLSGCFVFGYTRQMKITLTNESGLEIEKVVIKFFYYDKKHPDDLKPFYIPHFLAEPSESAEVTT